MSKLKDICILCDCVISNCENFEQFNVYSDIRNELIEIRTNCENIMNTICESVDINSNSDSLSIEDSIYIHDESIDLYRNVKYTFDDIELNEEEKKIWEEEKEAFYGEWMCCERTKLLLKFFKSELRFTNKEILIITEDEARKYEDSLS